MKTFIIIMMPVTVFLLWTMFIKFKGATIKLTILLVISMIIPVIYYDMSKNFWPSGLVMIIVSTGLFVVFSYIVSLQKGVMSNTIYFYEVFIFSGIILIFLLLDEMKPFKKLEETLISPNFFINLDLLVSGLLIILLLILVVLFIRLSYSKGGGMRKRY